VPEKSTTPTQGTRRLPKPPGDDADSQDAQFKQCLHATILIAEVAWPPKLAGNTER
jgi:hypothetical protein